MRLIIISGSSKGLGLAIKNQISNNFRTLEINRNCSELLTSDCLNIDFQSIDTIKVKISSFLEISNLIDLDEIIYINNAATISPLKSIDETEFYDLAYVYNVNVFTPIEIINCLVNYSRINRKRLKVINISSGAINKNIHGWSLYSSSKLAMHSLIESYKLETNYEDGFSFISIDPGLMNTSMQNTIMEYESSNGIKSIKSDSDIVEPKIIASIIYEQLILKCNFDIGFNGIKQILMGRKKS